MGGSRNAHHLAWLAAAFATVALAFILATVALQRSMARIDADVADLQTNSLPSVKHLTTGRSIMRELRRELADLRDSERAAWSESLARVAQLRADLDPELDTYRSTQWYAGERELFDTNLRPSLERFDRELAELARRAGDALDADWRGALRRLESAADATDRAIAELLDLNHLQSDAATARILRTRHASARLALQLNLACSLVAIAATWLALRASRRVQRIAQAHADLLRTRADELEAFAQRVAHDLMTPMTTVTMSLAAVGRRHDDPQTKASVQRASRAVERARRMVQGIFNYARSGARPRADARAPLGPCIHAAVEDLLASEAESSPVVEVEPLDDCVVACDEIVVGVILANLLSNASKYTKGAPVRRIVIRARVRADRARVEVEDTGPGLPSGLESSMFEPYVRGPGVTQPGLGLGLATVKRLALAHGGAVGAQRGQIGALFWFELPRAPPPPLPEGSRAPPHGDGAAARALP